MKIEIWSDFACPYCYIGEKKLEKALDELGLHKDVEIGFRSFQLNEKAVRHENVDLNSLISKKYGISYDQAKAANQGIIQGAKEVGLNYDFDIIKPGNTGLAHEVYKYCASLGKGQEMVDLLFSGYFEKGLDISSEEVLMDLGQQVDLAKGDLERLISERTFMKAVKDDQKKAFELGISSVPFFIIDDKYTVSGAQSVANFKDVLAKARL